jgi:hypothetical protein
MLIYEFMRMILIRIIRMSRRTLLIIDLESRDPDFSHSKHRDIRMH